MPSNFTYLNEISASDGFYALDYTAPSITITNFPANKVSPTFIKVHTSIFDQGGLTSAGIQIDGTVGSIYDFTTNGNTATFFFDVTATGGFNITATDIAGNESTLLSTGYFISATNIDIIPPVIEFTANPESRIIGPDSIGYVHVKVTDNQSIAAIASNFVLTEDSIGEIIPIFTQTSYNTVEFDIRIVESGSIVLSAIDDAHNATVASDGPWIAMCSKGKKINLTNFLPSHLKESEMFDFTEFFENFLNTMYEDKVNGCNISILEKIDRLKNFKDADAVDYQFFQYFANNFGYEVDINKETVGQFSIGDSASEDEINNYIRLSLKNIPSFNKIKTTEDALQVVLFSFGVVAELLYLWTNDYDMNWYQESVSDPINVRNEIPDVVPPYYPTPHFRVSVNYSMTPPSWTENYDKIIKVFNNIKSINTVLRGLTGYYEPNVQDPRTDPIAFGYQVAIESVGQIEIPWVGPPATYP